MSIFREGKREGREEGRKGREEGRKGREEGKGRVANLGIRPKRFFQRFFNNGLSVQHDSIPRVDNIEMRGREGKGFFCPT